MIQSYQAQNYHVNSQTNHLEQLRQEHQNAANYWQGQIHYWGLIGYRWESYWYTTRSWFRRVRRQGWRQVPVYGWIHNPQAEINRHQLQEAANLFAQMRDNSSQQGQSQVITNQEQITLLQRRIVTLQQELVSLRG